MDERERIELLARYADTRRVLTEEDAAEMSKLRAEHDEVKRAMHAQLNSGRHGGKRMKELERRELEIFGKLIGISCRDAVWEDFFDGKLKLIVEDGALEGEYQNWSILADDDEQAVPGKVTLKVWRS